MAGEVGPGLPVTSTHSRSNLPFRARGRIVNEPEPRPNPMHCFARFGGDDWGHAAPGSPVWRPKGLPRLTPTRDLPASGKRLTWEGIGRYYGILALRYRSSALSPGY